MPKELTLHDVIGAIEDLSHKTEGRFAQMDGRLDKMDGRLDKMDGRLDKMDDRFAQMDERFDEIHEQISTFSDLMDSRFDEVNNRFMCIENTMVTKDHLDKKIGGLRGEFITVDRKADAKTNTLVGILRDRKTLTVANCKTIADVGPFRKV